MSGKSNGNGFDKQVIEAGKTTSEELVSKKLLNDIHGRLMTSLWKLWADHQQINVMVEPTIYSRITILSFTQMAAMTAIDVAMPEEQFVDICLDNYREALRRAPRYG